MSKLFAIILSLTLIILPVHNVNAGGGAYAQQILGMANGIAGSTILMKCQMGAAQPSLAVYMAGGVTYIISELSTSKKKSSDISSNSKKLDDLKANMSQGGDYQKAAVEMQIADEKSNLEFIQKRRKWMMALKAMYTVATALAAIEAIVKYPPILKTDIAVCTMVGPAGVALDAGTIALIAAAYAALSASGSIKGAAVGMAAGYAVAYVAKELAIKMTVGAMITNATIAMLNLAEGRLAFFGATTALVVMIDSDLAKQEDETKKRIADLEKVKSSFVQATGGLAEGSSDPSKDGTTPGAGDGAKDPTKIYGIKELPKGTELAQNCYSQSPSGEVSYSIEACKSPVKITKPTFQPDFEIPTLAAGATSSAELAQALASGNAGKADLEATKLASMAGKLDKIKDDLIKKVNDKLVQDGKKPIDIKATLDKQVADFNAALNKANPGSAGSSLANTSTNSEAKVSEIKKEEVETTKVNSAETINASNVGNAGAIDLSKIESGSVPGSEENKNMDDKNKVASIDESLNQFEDNQSDIAKDEGVSIFKQVSNRYLLNYDRIFKRKEITPPLAEPQK